MIHQADSERKDLAAYIEEARASGAVRIDSGDDEFFVVAPHRWRAAAPAPFEDAGDLLQSPLKRAAYSDRTAWLMATLSELAYLPFEKDDEARMNLAATLASADLVFQGFFNDPGTGTQAYLARRPNEFTVLAFRGTEQDRKDIFTDLDARFYKTPDGQAHRGFAKAYENIRNQIIPALEALEEKEDLHRLFITGHSLGGALATVAARDLEGKFLVASCYTFGSPRVGTAEWSDAAKTPIYRVVNGADGVPLVPPSAIMRNILSALPTVPFMRWLEKPVEKMLRHGYAGFQHAGDLRFLKGATDTAHLKIGSIAAWERIKHLLVGKLVGAVKTLSPSALSATFADHSISHYVHKLRKIAADRN